MAKRATSKKDESPGEENALEADGFYVVVEMSLVAGRRKAFNAYERDVLKTMAPFGGTLVVAMRPSGADTARPDEIHVLRFETENALSRMAKK